MAENTLGFKINNNRNMDILPGVHGVFSQMKSLQPGGKVATVVSDYGDMLFQEIPASFGSIWLSRYHMVHDAKLSAEADAHTLESMHMVSGNVSYHPDGLRDPLSIKASEWQMLYLPHVFNEVILPAGTDLMTLDFHYNLPWLQTLAPYFKDLDIFLEKVERKVPAVLCKQPVPVPGKVINLMTDFLGCHNQGINNQLFIERHMSDWLATSLESPFLSGPEPLTIQKDEHERMLDIYEFMMHNLSEPITMEMLVKRACLNDFKFKRIFKAMFKMPVHQLLIEKRLENAMILVREKEISIEDIAGIAGYETASAFSKKFKQRYGKPPSWFRIH